MASSGRARSCDRRLSSIGVRLGSHALPLSLLVIGCGGSSGGLASSHTDAGGQTPFFSDLELGVIRAELGTLPDQPPVDSTNAYADSALAAALGEKLFFDTAYSSNGQVSCSTCHIPEKGFQDDRDSTSLGLGFTGRHAPTLLNAAYGTARSSGTVWQFWDGRKDSMWSQALGPPESSIEMGSARSKIALLIFDKYRVDYEAAFGGPMRLMRDPATSQPLAPETAFPGRVGDPATVAWDALPEDLRTDITRIYVNFGKALQAYERTATFTSRNSRFDGFHKAIAAGAPDSDELTATEKNGLKLFVGKAQCITCHRGPNFTDQKFHNIGVLQEGDHVPKEDNGRETGVASVKVDEFNCRSGWSDQSDIDQCAVTQLEAKAADHGAFKTPTLRSVAHTAPYFHTGALPTLESVIEFYNAGGNPASSGSSTDGGATPPEPGIEPLNLSEQEKLELIAFLKALDGKP